MHERAAATAPRLYAFTPLFFFPQALVVEYLHDKGLLHARGLMGENPVACSWAQQIQARLGSGCPYHCCSLLCMLLAAGRSDSSLCPACLAEFAEQRLFPASGLEGGQSRLAKWQKLGKLHAHLEADILKANPTWKEKHIPDK